MKIKSNYLDDEMLRTIIAKAADRVNRTYTADITLYRLRQLEDKAFEIFLRPGMNTSVFIKVSPGNKVLNGICFHGHVAFLTELYKQSHSLIIEKPMQYSAYARSEGGQDFDKLTSLEDFTWNTIHNPVPFSDFCECPLFRQRNIEDRYWILVDNLDPTAG